MESAVDTRQERHEEQRAYWNGEAGGRWLARADNTDFMLRPVLDAAIDHAKPAPGETILDVGCGCGASLIALARVVGETGRVVGIDISEQMLDLARERTRAFPQVECLVADAATHDFSALGADLIFSRFGVMFFGDPVAAFANMKRALKPGGRIVFACWRPIQENGWMDVPLRAAYKHVPRQPRPGPEDPGPFSFADPARVTRIFREAGLPEPTFTKLDVMLDIAAGGTIDDAVRSASEIGATARALQDQPADLRAAALEEVRRALEQHATPSGVPLTGAVWLVEARA